MRRIVGNNHHPEAIKVEWKGLARRNQKLSHNAKGSRKASIDISRKRLWMGLTLMRGPINLSEYFGNTIRQEWRKERKREKGIRIEFQFRSQAAISQPKMKPTKVTANIKFSKEPDKRQSYLQAELTTERTRNLAGTINPIVRHASHENKTNA